MTKKLWLGWRTILVGWSAALLALTPVDLVSGQAMSGWIVLAVLAVYALAVAWEWSAILKTRMAAAHVGADGMVTQARNHSIALAVSGLLVGLPLSALALYAMTGLFGSFTANTGLTTAIVLALIVSYVMARGWSFNCAPDWIES